MTFVNLSHLTKQFSSHKKVVNDLSLVIPDGKITALLGPSGSGKTTTLKMIAGLISPTQGNIYFDGQSIMHQPPEKRGAAMVFQNHLLFPHLSIRDNIGFGLKMRGEKAADIRMKVDRMLEKVQLAGLGKSRPGQLSGGQQQRAALARALVIEPRVLLLDEPLSNLDEFLKDEMRELIQTIQRELGITTLFVTHDQQDAVILADQIALMIQGVIKQFGSPMTFYEQPATVEVARFFGMRNFLAGVGFGSSVKTLIGEFRINQKDQIQGETLLSIRPENIQVLHKDQSLNENCVVGCVKACVYLGTGSRILAAVADEVLEIQAASTLSSRYQPGDKITLFFPPEKICLFSQ